MATHSPIKGQSEISDAYESIKDEINRFIVGNQELLEVIFIALLAEGHVLVEGIPGTAKSTLVKAIARLMDFDFHRVQCAVDTQPADVIGIRIWDFQQQEFVVKKGPIFTNILLIDEINRLPPKSQSAFIEVMGERQATIDGITMPVESPFITIATQNPFEREGTFPLIEAQKDRFMFSHRSDYLGGDAELEIIRRENSGTLDWAAFTASLTPKIRKRDLLSFSQHLKNIHVEDPILLYIRDLVIATRQHSDVQIGVSARGSIALVRGAKVFAAIQNRNYVLPDDVKRLAPFAFQHRILLNREAEFSGITPNQVVQDVLERTGVL